MPKKFDRALAPLASARQLIALWDERDSRYSVRKAHGVRSPLSEREAASVIAFRRSEADDLPARDRSIALTTLSAWKPPVVAW